MARERAERSLSGRGAREDGSLASPRQAEGDARDGPSSATAAPLVERLRVALGAIDGIEAAYLFGSAARATAGSLSDVDVAVLVGRRGAGERTLELIAALRPAVAPHRLDLVVLDEAPPTLAFRVIRDGIVLHGERSIAAARHRVRVTLHYMDLMPLRRALREGTSHRLEKGRHGRP